MVWCSVKKKQDSFIVLLSTGSRTRMRLLNISINFPQIFTDGVREDVKTLFRTVGVRKLPDAKQGCRTQSLGVRYVIKRNVSEFT